MAPPPSGRQLSLVAHGQELTVVEVGGGIRSYRAPGPDGRLVDVIDPYTEDEMCAGGRGQLLAPWPNRTCEGSYEWQGRKHQLPITEVEAGNAIHGLVRFASWNLPERTPEPWTPQTPVDSAGLTYRLHPQPGWDWTLDLRVTYRLATTGLEVRFSARNMSDTPCPFGAGWHPYLQAFGGLVDDLTLTVPAATALDADGRGIPTGRHPVEGTGTDFRRGRRIGAAHLDVALTDLERDDHGRAWATVEGDGGRRVRLWMDDKYRYAMVFTGDTLADTSRRRRGLAVEPMTCPPNMLRSGEDRLTLEPNGSFEATWGLDPFS